MAMWLSKFLKRPTNCRKVIIRGNDLTEQAAMFLRFFVNVSSKVTVSVVVGC